MNGDRIRKILIFILFGFSVFFLSACDQADDVPAPSDKPAAAQTGNQTGPADSVNPLPELRLTSSTDYRQVGWDYTDASVSIRGTDYKGVSCDYTGSLEIKLRGNSTAQRDKRPFKIKLEKKADLFGMGESKHWVLLANDIDHTQMRNKLLLDFSGALGTESYMESTWVNLYYNNDYMGVYQLCEHIRVGKTRIDILDWDDIAEEAALAIAQTSEAADAKVFQKALEDAMEQDYTWIDTRTVSVDGTDYTIPDSVVIPEANGGFVLEMDFYSLQQPSLARTQTPYRQPLYFNTPEPADARAFSVTSLYKYALGYVTTFEYALHSDDFFFRNTDPHYQVSRTGWFDWERGWDNAAFEPVDYQDAENDGKHYSQLFDMDSLVNNFIFCEFAMNWDSMKNSFHLYKDIGKPAQIGPQWDFDWAWGNRNMFGIDTNVPTEWHTTCTYFTNEQYYQSVQWNTQLIRDPYFLVRAYEKYKEIRPTLIEDMLKDGGTIDTYAAYLRDAALANDEKWDYSYRQYGGEPFEEATEHMKQFITERIKWMDKQFTSLETFIASLNVYHPSSQLAVSDIQTQADGSVTITASVSDDSISAVVFQVNGTTQAESAAAGGTASVSIPKSALTDGSAQNVVEIKAKGPDGKYLYDSSYSKPSNYNLVISNYKIW